MIPSEGVALSVINAVTASVASFFCVRMIMLARFQRLPNATLTVLVGSGAALLWAAALFIVVGFERGRLVTNLDTDDLGDDEVTPFCKFQGAHGGHGQTVTLAWIWLWRNVSVD